MVMKKVITIMLLGLAVLTAKAQKAELARGADVSWCTEMEADGRKFYNAEGTETEMMASM
jgi:arabinogalactan endo-1,4-beta-galactosidase